MYWIGESALTITPTVATSVNDLTLCPITAALEYWDESDRIWRPHSELVGGSGVGYAGQTEQPEI